MKKTSILGAIALLLLFAACTKQEAVPAAAAGEVKANWTADNRQTSNASKAYPPYTIYNNVWGSGAGYQSIWANNAAQWGVWSQHPSGNVKSYPNSGIKIQRALSGLNSCTSHYDVTVPSGGDWSSTYDVWTANDQYEIMLWMNYRGNVGPISTTYPAQTIFTSGTSVGGHSWKIYKGPGSVSGRTVFSFLRTSNSNKGDVDIKAILNFLKNNGQIGNITLDRVEFGFEISGTPEGYDHKCNDFYVKYS